MISSPLLSRLGVARAAWVVFTASLATLVLELVTDRLLAPFIGVSLHTWTSVIGVVLAGISLGSWAGGRLADRAGGPRWLAWLLGGGALSTLLMLGWVRVLGSGEALYALPLLPRALGLSLLTLFAPCFLLAMVRPVALTLLLPDLRRTGRTVGLLQSLDTLGGLVGTVLTGFVLVAHFEVPTLVLAVAGVLALTAVLAWPGTSPGTPPTPASGLPSAAPVLLVDVPVRREWLGLVGNERLACAVVACSSFCMMTLEMAASRLLAPSFGVSLVSWTSLFAVMLTGIAVGNGLGGVIADRWPRQEVLAGWLLAAGAACLGAAGVHRALVTQGAFSGYGLVARVMLHTTLVFLPPVMLLGTLSPQVTRLALTDLRHAGRTAGRIAAWSTGGALAGTFLTGWVLIARLGVYALVLLCAAGLVGLALVLGRPRYRPRFAAALTTVLLAGAALVYLRVFRSQCTVETDYFCIRVRDGVREGQPIRVMWLDHLIHSMSRLEDPGYLHYPHWRTQAEFVQLAASRTPAPRLLVIGGGGYTMPRWVEAFVPEAQVEVVEIDPEVTRVALRDFGVRPDTRIRSYNLDGRQFVQELAPAGAYDVIIQDAVNDLSVPYHLTTREYDARIRRLLKPEGVFLLTLIDDFERGRFVGAAVATFQESFPEMRVLLPANSARQGRGLFILAGSSQPIELEAVARALAARGGGAPRTEMLSPGELDAWLAARPRTVLTDAYAPVDALLGADVFARDR